METKDVEAAVKLARERHKPKYMLVNEKPYDEPTK